MPTSSIPVEAVCRRLPPFATTRVPGRRACPLRRRPRKEEAVVRLHRALGIGARRAARDARVDGRLARRRERVLRRRARAEGAQGERARHSHAAQDSTEVLHDSLLVRPAWRRGSERATGGASSRWRDEAVSRSPTMSLVTRRCPARTTPPMPPSVARARAPTGDRLTQGVGEATRTSTIAAERQRFPGSRALFAEFSAGGTC
jgi:hypothetical protein